MAVRIEYILTFIFLILVVAVFGFNPISKEGVSSKGEREVMFENSLFEDIKSDNTGRKIYSKKAVKYNNYVDFKEVNLTDELGHTLLSKKAIYARDSLFMSKSIKVSRDDGIDFFTESLNYNLKKKIISTEEPFLLEFNRTTIRGKRLNLYVDGKTITAYNIDAHIWFTPQEQ